MNDHAEPTERLKYYSFKYEKYLVCVYIYYWCLLIEWYTLNELVMLSKSLKVYPCVRLFTSYNLQVNVYLNFILHFELVYTNLF